MEDDFDSFEPEDDPRDDTLDVFMGGGIPEKEPQPWPEDEVTVEPEPEGPVPQFPWDAGPMRAQNLQGHFDCWIGEVQDVHDDAVDNLLGLKQVIDVVRVGVAWGVNNEPTTHEMPQANCQPTPAITKAVPWPLRHDQEVYNVSTGDAVAVITGRDGVNYFFTDDLPFPAQVIKNGDAASVNEDNVGGAGLTTLKVRRQKQTGDPDSAPASLAELLTAAGENVDIANVKILAPTNTHHGYRTGDYCWVQKRGRYYYTWPIRDSFSAYLVNAGPASEADHEDSMYWFREYVSTVTTATNDWSITEWGRMRTDPSGSGGVFGRWGAAMNMAEWPSGTHLVATVTDPGDQQAVPDGAVRVVVHAYADPTGSEVWYAFYHKPMLFTDEGEGTTVAEVTKGTFVGENDATVSVAETAAGHATVTVDVDIATATEIELSVAEHYSVLATGTTDVLLDARDWRGREITWDYSYDLAASGIDTLDTGAHGQISMVSGYNIADVDLFYVQDSDDVRVYVDVSDGGKLRTEIVDNEYGMRISLCIRASKVIYIS